MIIYEVFRIREKGMWRGLFNRNGGFCGGGS